MTLDQSLTCGRCKKTKNPNDFYTRKSGRYAGMRQYYCKQCRKEIAHEYHITHDHYSTKQHHKKGINKPMNENKECAIYLGVVIAETMLGKIFPNAKRMPNNNKGFDFICTKDLRIDVKSSVLHIKTYRNKHQNRWQFGIKRNKDTDIFACLAFNNRQELKLQHFWLIPSDVINSQNSLKISDSEKSLNKWKKYEHDIKEVN